MIPALEKPIATLSNIYENHGYQLQVDWAYLFSAYQEIQKHWEDNFVKINRVNLVILSEAPLWGEDKKYIYNPKANQSQYFFYSDIDPILEYKALPKPKLKSNFITTLNQLGILIVDVSPFALNKTDTRLSYRKIKTREYNKLIESCWKSYLVPILNRLDIDHVKFIFRYLPVKTALLPLLSQHTGIRQFDAIYKRGGGINKEKLKAVYLSA